MNRIEYICRKVCELKEIDPDANGYGLGATMPKGSIYKLWEYQIPFVKLVVEECENGIK